MTITLTAGGLAGYGTVWGLQKFAGLRIALSVPGYGVRVIRMDLMKQKSPIKATASLGILLSFYLCTRPLALPPAREVT